MFGPVTSLLKELGQRLHEVTADDNPYGYLVQHLSMALQGEDSTSGARSQDFPEFQWD